ncbi:MAG: nickel-responsive transcriptional regulator NikR [Nitrospinota bacterium]
MRRTVRFGISADGELTERFDRAIAEGGYTNRSEAIRDLMRSHLVRQEWRKDEEVIGVVSLLYDHRKRELSRELISHQHHNEGRVLSSLHVHLDRDHCLEVIVVRGRAAQIKALAGKLIGTKGVKHGDWITTSLGRSL